MAKQLQIRGGNTAQHATFTGVVRELTVDTTKQTVVVHDGTTAGGFPLARESVVTALNNRLTLVNNTADNTKNVLSATKLTTARTIAITGDITWSTSFDGSGNVTSAGTLANSGVTAGTYRSVTTDAKGRVTAGTNPTTLTGYGITDAYNKTEIDTFIQGFKPKTEVKLATTVNITLSGAQTIDGISAIVGDRVLVKNQTTKSENGIYVVSATSWTRATDSDSALELTGSYCFVSQGSTQSDTGWYMNSDSVVLGTTAIVWIQFTGTGAYAPISHVGTNGTSHAAVTQSVNGFMLSTDKLKLDSATNINTVNTIVMRDSSGNFTAGLITGTSFNSITGLSSTTPLVNGTAAIGTSTTTARADHVHPVQTTISGSAGSVVASEVLKFDTGTTEGTDLYTFNGSTAKTIDIKAGTNVTLNKTAGSVTIDVSESNLMTKAQFNALADERRANRAGSGFDNFGKGNSITTVNVNEGIYTTISGANTLFMGKSSNNIGSSITNYPLSSINGIVQSLLRINTDLNSDANNVILLPTAPTIYPSTATLTAEQIASGVIKHADSSNSGLIVNGKFDTDTSGWTSSNSTLSIDAGRLKVTNTTTGNGFAYQSQTFIIGKKYIIEFQQQYGNRQGSVRVGTTNIGGEIFNEYSADTTGTATNGKIEFIATATTLYITLVTSAGSIGDYRFFDNIAVYPADAISRSDLVFLESWHEDISEKNFIYPLGNVQYLGTDTDGLTGIANGSFTGFETYSLFGNWQTSSGLIGKGYVWTNLTETQKKLFVANKDNNCYLDGDKVIQVRYRIRIVQGVSDSINSFSKSNSSSYLALNESGVGSSFLINAKGKQTSIAETKDYASRVTTGTYGYQGSNTTLGVDTVSGDLVSVTTFGTPTNVAYEGKCYALPIALVHRRNQGFYHNVYNPNGTKLAVDGNRFYNTVTSFTSISDCFTDTKLTTASGYIGTTSSRPDGLFYDQVHEGDIQDLRNSSKKVEDCNRLISREFNKLVSGTYRGKEGEIYTATVTQQTADGTSATITYYTSQNKDLPVEGGSILHNGATARILYYSVSGATVTIVLDRQIVRKNQFDLLIPLKSNRTKSNTLLYCDIIGNPANYPTAWKQNGVFGTPLIVAEDGTNLLPTGAKSTFKLSRKANAAPLLCLRSTDSGLTWTSFTPTFNTTTNEITLTNEPAANLVMVYYQTHTSMTVVGVNSECLTYGEVFASTYFNKGFGVDLTSNLIGKISTYGALDSWRTYGLPYSISKEGVYIKYSTPTHNTVVLPSVYSPAAKVFPYLTRTNGKAYLNLVFKEMKYNGTTWGDHDNTFNIVDNVSTTTDGNGQTILIGQKTVELPYFIDAGE